jgi:hypothetical protein
MKELTAADWARLRGPRKWRAADARRILARWRASGLSLNAFSRENRIGRKRLRWWKQQLADWGEDKAAIVGLAPAVPISAGTNAAAVSIRLAEGTCIEVDSCSAVSPEWISRLMRGLGRRG